MAKLTEQEQQEVIRLIEAGRPLPEKYRFLLFDDNREVELVRNEEIDEVTTMRCLKCGSSRVDFEYGKCLLCGAAAGLRGEQCYVTNETKKILLAHAEGLSAYGVTIEKHQVIKKGIAPPDAMGFQIDPLGAIGLGLTVADSLNDGVLRKLVRFLWSLKLPKEEILCLRLAEPDAITEILDNKNESRDSAQ